jgi:cyclopropane fatty-acyl-phospholipid synthase-like methyltransferase
MSEHTYNNFNTQPDPPHQPWYLKKILKPIQTNKIRTILDAGCGDGNFASSLAGYGFQMYGIDLSESGIGIACKRECGTFAVASMYGDLKILFQGIEYFDAIIAIDTIEHLYSPRIFARRSFEALRPGGMLIVTVPYWGYLKNIVMALTNRLDDALTTLWDGGHIKHWSRNTLTELMQEQSYEVVSFEGCGRPIPFLWSAMMMVFRKPQLLPINSNCKSAG